MYVSITLALLISISPYYTTLKVTVYISLPPGYHPKLIINPVAYDDTQSISTVMR